MATSLADDLATVQADISAAAAEAAKRIEQCATAERLGDAARAEAKAADDRCRASDAALASVVAELDSARAAFDQERAFQRQVLVVLLEMYEYLLIF